MTKSNELTTTTARPDSSDPRKRMKQIREMVAKAIKEGSRVDLLPLNAADKARALVALQDLYEAEKASHDKATKHIAALIDRNSSTEELVSHISMESFFSTAKLQAKVGDLKDICEKQTKGLKDQHEIIRRQIDKETDLMSRNAVLEEERKALKATIAIFAGDNA